MPKSASAQAAFSGGQIIQSVIALRKVQECNILLAWPYAEAEREASMRQQGTYEEDLCDEHQSSTGRTLLGLKTEGQMPSLTLA